LDADLLTRKAVPRKQTLPEADTNGVIEAWLRDLAAIQQSPQSRLGYKRAAAAIHNLEAPIESYVDADGTLRRIPHIGPSSTRVILEVLRTGRSEIVERAIQKSGRATDVEKRRGLRQGFLIAHPGAGGARQFPTSGTGHQRPPR
jgi:hypothetical protein